MMQIGLFDCQQRFDQLNAIIDWESASITEL